jgi:hypothetical protein
MIANARYLNVELLECVWQVLDGVSIGCVHLGCS